MDKKPHELEIVRATENSIIASDNMTAAFAKLEVNPLDEFLQKLYECAERNSAIATRNMLIAERRANGSAEEYESFETYSDVPWLRQHEEIMV